MSSSTSITSSSSSLEVPQPPLLTAGDHPAAFSKLSGLHEWISLENKRVKHWWASRSTDIHKLYVNQVHGTDELRSQLNEQLRALDGRIDNQCALVTELQDWFRRRAELHQDYSIKLDKLSKSLFARHKEQKVKREQWNLFSMYNCWLLLVNGTKKDARDHSAMADVYLNNVIPRFTQVQEDVQRIFKKCRDIGYESHEELLKVLHELHTTMRTYHMYQAEFMSAENKLQNLEAQKTKLEQTNPKEKLEKRKKFKVIEKEIEKRKSKYRDAKLKALKARNEYILSMESANSSIHKYFVEDLSDVVDCMDFGLHGSIAKALMTHISGEECFKRTLQNGIDDLSKAINNLDSRHDKQRFLEYNNAAFMLPKKFDFQGYKGDELNLVMVTQPIQEEMEKRYAHLVSRLTNLKTESEETWKTIETAEKTLLQMINTRDYDIAHYFSDEPQPDTKTPEAVVVKRKADRQETEEFYLGKFRDYTLGSNLICRLQARFELMRKALGDENQAMASPTPTRNLVNKPRRRRIGKTPIMGQPRLFGGSLEEYLEATGQEIPLIMKSCIRVINLYGLHHQGIFRVSGSQVEINNFRETFEKMEDPLADVTDASDINSIAGVLKLYLRELREPIFPTVYFDQFMEIAQLESKQDFVNKVREVVMSLPRAVFVVMRYLFAFLNHLSEFSDENMMDPYNLAICFGPTLVPIPEDKDQVQYQNLVNELIKNIIIFFEDIFPYDGGPVYEKFISRDSLDLDADIADAPTEDPDTVDSEPGQSEDDSVFRDPITLQLFGKSDVLAVAQFDFNARSERELSFNKGDVVLLHSQASPDWWKGSINGKTGLIPDKYIFLKIKDEDKERGTERGPGDECDKRRASSSSDPTMKASHLAEVLGRVSPNEGAPSPGTSRLSSSSQGRNQSPSFVDRQSIGGSSSPVPSLSSLSSAGDVGEMESPYDGGLPLASPSNGPAVPRISQTQEETGIAAHAPAVAHARSPASTPTPSPSAASGSAGHQRSLLTSDSLSSLSSTHFHTLGSSRVRLSETTRLCTSLSESCAVPVDTSTSSSSSSSISGHDWRALHSRPSSQGSLSSSSSEERIGLPRRGNWEGSSFGKGKVVTAGAPDLVMDLPVAPLSSSPKEQANLSVSPRLHRCDAHVSPPPSRGKTSPSSRSPDRVAMTAAECFAKQNQSTLKKAAALGKSLSCTVGGSSDAQTQTLTPAKISTSISTDSPCYKDSTSSSEDESLPLRGTSPAASVSALVRTRDSGAQSTESEPPSHPHAEEVIIEVRAAADMVPSEALPTPSTPKLAARYLKAVAASGGGSGVAVKPQVRVKPTVLKKPSLPPSATAPDPDASTTKFPI